MVETIPSLTYGTVTGRFLAAVADSDSDLDKNPDGVPLTGTVKFTPSVSALLLNATTPPMTVLPAAITAVLDDEGYISLNGDRGVNLIATDTMDTSPTEFTYEVSFQNIRYAGSANLPYAPFSIAVPANTITDLTLTAPLPTSSGVPVVRDETAIYQAAASVAAAVETAEGILEQVRDAVDNPKPVERAQLAADVKITLTKADTSANVLGANGRLSDTSVNVSGQNLNDLKDSGWFRGNNMTNAPVAGYAWLFVHVVSDDTRTWAEQRATVFYGGDPAPAYEHEQYVRWLRAGTWTAWKPLGDERGAYDPVARLALNGRLGPAGVGLPLDGSVDANDLVDTGWYRLYNGKHMPSAEWFYITVQGHDGSFTIQEAVGYTGATSAQRFVRQKQNGSWSPWVLTEDANGSADGVLRTLLSPAERIGTTGMNIRNGDLNNFTQNGFYAGDNLGNSPDGSKGAFYIDVQRTTADGGEYTWQRAAAAGLGTANVGYSWQRFQEGTGGWSTWRLMGDPAGAVDGLTRGDITARWGKTAANLTGGDLNNFTQAGLYRGSDLINAPAANGTGWFYVAVESHDGGGWIKQTVTAYTGTADRTTWTRQKRNGYWDAWVQLADKDGAYDKVSRDVLTYGGRLGPQAVEMANADVNTFILNGWYLGGSNAVNGPGFGRFVILVSSVGTGYIHQRLHGLTGDLAQREYVRTQNGGPGSSWGAWREVSNPVRSVNGITPDANGVVTVPGAATSDYNADVNAIRTSGTYLTGSAATNVPSNTGQAWIIQHVEGGANIGYQRAVLPLAHSAWERFRNGPGNTAWTEWRQVDAYALTAYVDNAIETRRPPTSSFAATASSSGQTVNPDGTWQRITMTSVDQDSNYQWDSSNNWYTIPFDGLYQVSAAIRPADGSFDVFTNVGIGVSDTQTDSPAVYWYTPGTFRNTLVYTRQTMFYAGQQVRMFAYTEGRKFAVTNASLGISLIEYAPQLE